MWSDGCGNPEVRTRRPRCEISDEPGEPGVRERRDTGLHENLRRCRNKTDSGRRDSWDRRRRSGPRLTGCHVCEGAVHGNRASHAYSSYGCGISPDGFVQTGTLCVELVNMDLAQGIMTRLIQKLLAD